MAFPPTYNEVIDPTFPPDTQQANQLGLDIRTLKTDLIQRFATLAGTFANRPTPDASWGGSGYGTLYFATDKYKIYQWNGTTWNDVSNSFIGGASVARVTSLGSTLTTVAPTTFYTTPVGVVGMYRFSSDIIITSNLGSPTGTFVGTNLLYTDESGNNVQQTMVSNAIPFNGTHYTLSWIFSVAGAQNIQYTIAHTGNVGTPVYNLRFNLEFLNQ
jgi:hypothetical protein